MPATAGLVVSQTWQYLHAIGVVNGVLGGDDLVFGFHLRNSGS